MEGFEVSSISAALLPISSVNSSLTILTISWPGWRLVNTFWPIAFSFTRLVNSLAILKFTSASNNALLTSLRVSATFISVILPCPFRSLKAVSSLLLSYQTSIWFYGNKFTVFKSYIKTLNIHPFLFFIINITMVCGKVIAAKNEKNKGIK